jgi:hypothetical protein
MFSLLECGGGGGGEETDWKEIIIYIGDYIYMGTYYLPGRGQVGATPSFC